MNEKQMTTEELTAQEQTDIGALVARLLDYINNTDDCVLRKEAAAALRDLSGEVQQLKVENDLLREDFDALVENRDTLRAEAAALKHDLSNAYMGRDIARHDADFAAAEVAALKEYINTTGKYRNALAKLAREKDMTTETTLDELEQELSRAADGVETSLEWRALNELRALRGLREERANYLRENGALRKELVHNCKRETEISNERHRLRAEVLSQSGQLEACRKELAALAKRILDLQTKYDDIKGTK